jgi:hypothetical protein
METRREPVDAAELMSQFGSDQPLRTVVLPDGCTQRLGRLRRELIIRGEEFADL